jgi:hypothetical protein
MAWRCCSVTAGVACAPGPWYGLLGWCALTVGKVVADLVYGPCDSPIGHGRPTTNPPTIHDRPSIRFRLLICTMG